MSHLKQIKISKLEL